MDDALVECITKGVYKKNNNKKIRYIVF